MLSSVVLTLVSKSQYIKEAHNRRPPSVFPLVPKRLIMPGISLPVVYVLWVTVQIKLEFTRIPSYYQFPLDRAREGYPAHGQLFLPLCSVAELFDLVEEVAGRESLDYQFYLILVAACVGIG